MKTCGDFVVKRLPREIASTGHEIFLKEHKLKHSDGVIKNILMACNLPPYLTTQNICEIFLKFGEMSHVRISTAPVPDAELVNVHAANSVDEFKFKIAYITYKSYKGIEKALSPKHPLPALTQLNTFNTGISRWHQEYEDAIQNEKDLQKDVDKFMATFEAKETAEKSTPEVDDDGWTTVTKDAPKAFQQNESFVSRIENKLEKQKQKKELENFYTFQIRESKKKDIISLRTKFSQDQKKMEAIKKNRKYKPY